jgi:hypothetical protein
MLTGKKAFPGETQASIIAKILDHDPPPVSSLEPPGKLSPPALDRLVATCLAKDREDRWQTMRDVCRELKWIKEGSGQAATVAPFAARARVRQWLGWAAAVVLLISTAVLGIVHFRETPPEARATRFFVLPPQNTSFARAPQVLTVSPDGTKLAFQASGGPGGTRPLWVQSLDSLSAQPLPGTEGASQHFWSADSRYLAFYSQGKLKKIDVTGGPPQVLCDVTGTGENGSWNREGVILFTSAGTRGVEGGVPSGSLIHRVSAAGGVPTRVTSIDAAQGETAHLWPHFLPDGHHFLYLALNKDIAKSAIRVGSLDSTDSKFLLNAVSSVQYAPPGYLLFQRDATLMAQPFDADALELTGDAFPVVERVQGERSTRSDSFFGFSKRRAGIPPQGRLDYPVGLVRPQWKRVESDWGAGRIHQSQTLTRRETNCGYSHDRHRRSWRHLGLGSLAQHPDSLDLCRGR